MNNTAKSSNATPSPRFCAHIFLHRLAIFSHKTTGGLISPRIPPCNTPRDISRIVMLRIYNALNAPAWFKWLDTLTYLQQYIIRVFPTFSRFTFNWWKTSGIIRTEGSDLLIFLFLEKGRFKTTLHHSRYIPP